MKPQQYTLKITGRVRMGCHYSISLETTSLVHEANCVFRRGTSILQNGGRADECKNRSTHTYLYLRVLENTSVLQNDVCATLKSINDNPHLPNFLTDIFGITNSKIQNPTSERPLQRFVLYYPKLEIWATSYQSSFVNHWQITHVCFL